jgi:hypothetical protein
MAEPSTESRQKAFAILIRHGDVLQDDASLNDLIDDIAAAIDGAALKISASVRCNIS